MIKLSYLVRAVLGLVVLLVFLGWMTVQNETTRASGREVVLQTNPVDPRDVFFGHYAILGYRDFAPGDVQIPWSEGQGFEDDGIVYVALSDSGEFFTPMETYSTWSEAVATGQPVLKARLQAGYAREGELPDQYHVRFDLPRQYFADPDTAMALQTEFRNANRLQRNRDRWEFCVALQQTDPATFEESYRCQDLDLSDEPTTDIPQYGVILSVSEAGDAVIKGLYLDGRQVYDSLNGPRFELARAE